MRRIELVCLDVGGVMYDDGVYRRALRDAIREMGASMSDAEFDDAYEECRRTQHGSFRRRLTERFLPGALSGGSGRDAVDEEVRRRASVHWSYPADALEPDVLPCCAELRDRGHRLAVVANQPSSIRDTLRRDGLDGFFECWAISEEIGLEKPDPRMYERVLADAGATPGRAVMVGDRLDYDIVPASVAGMRTVWVLRGEAPKDPSPEQLAVPGAAIRSLAELPAALDGLGAA